MLSAIRTDKKIIQIPVVRIRQNSICTRHDYSPSELRSLAQSISNLGILTPLLVRKVSSSEYELIDGERRLRAGVMCGRKKLPCIVENCTDKDAALRTLASNLTRTKPDFFDIADSMNNIANEYDMTFSELSRTLGIKHSEILTSQRLLRFTDEERELIREFGLTKEHALAAVRIENPSERRMTLSEIIEGGMNVLQSEAFIDELLTRKKRLHRLHQKSTLVLKTTRILENTINKAVDTMRESGLTVVTEQKETEGYIEYSVRIEKSTGKVTEVIRTA